MERKFLEDMGLEAANIDKIMEEHGKTVTPLQSGTETLQKQLSAALADVAARDKQLEGLKKTAGDHAEIQAALKKAQEDNKALAEKSAAELQGVKVTAALKLALNGKVENLDQALGLFDHSKIKLDDKGNLDKDTHAVISTLFPGAPAQQQGQPGQGGVEIKGAKPVQGADPTPNTDYQARLAEARKQGDNQLATSIISEAAESGVQLR